MKTNSNDKGKIKSIYMRKDSKRTISPRYPKVAEAPLTESRSVDRFESNAIYEIMSKMEKS